MQAVLDGIRRLPLADATELAFRFGSERYARALLVDLKQTPGNVELFDLDDMMIELRLGALDAEHTTSNQPTPHLTAALKACGQARSEAGPGFEGPACAPDRLHDLMVSLAKQRLVTP
jgi:hypothetical protein